MRAIRAFTLISGLSITACDPSAPIAINVLPERLFLLTVSDQVVATGAQLSFPTGVAIDAVGNIYIGDQANHRVRKVIPAGSARAVASVSAASFDPAVGLAGEGIAAAFGTNLAATTLTAGAVPLPTDLAGTTVKVRDSDGVERFAPLFSVAPGQVNYLVPQGTSPGPATVTVASADGTVSLGSAQISVVAPGLFSADATGQGVAAAVIFRRRADGSESYEEVARFDAALGCWVAVPIDLGPPSDEVTLVLFGTGLRFAAAASASIGEAAAPVLYAGAQGGFVGVDQVNLSLDRSLAGRGEVEVRLSVDGKAANVVRVSVR